MTHAAKRLAELLQDTGVKYLFGIPGGPWIPYMEAMREEGIEFVLTANEASAGIMADVCGRITGIPGACHGTFGPGATNLSTGVGGAYLDRSPLLAFTNEMPDAMLGRTTQMAIDHQALFRPITKWTCRVTAGRLEDYYRRAVRTALAEMPGPVHLGLPSDLAMEPVPESGLGPLPVPRTPLAGEDVLEAIGKTFLEAEKPILAVGLTAARLGLGEAVRILAETHRLPVLLTPMAKGMLPEDHPCYAGVLFHAVSNRLAETHGQAELVVGLGYDPVEFYY